MHRPRTALIDTHATTTYQPPNMHRRPVYMSCGLWRAGSAELAESSSALAQYVRAKGGARVIRRLLVACNGLAALKGLTSMRQWAAQVTPTCDTASTQGRGGCCWRVRAAPVRTCMGSYIRIWSPKSLTLEGEEPESLTLEGEEQVV